MRASEATLAEVQDGEVKLPLHLGFVQFDIDGDGKAETTLMEMAAHYLGGARVLPKDGTLPVTFDRGDVAWFRGYCHLRRAACRKEPRQGRPRAR